MSRSGFPILALRLPEGVYFKTNLTKASQDTAYRDITNLIERDALRKDLAGRQAIRTPPASISDNRILIFFELPGFVVNEELYPIKWVEPV